MKNKILIATALILISITCLSCSFFKFNKLIGFADQDLQGEIRSYPYTFVAGYARTNYMDTDCYSIFLLPSSPNAGYAPWDENAYDKLYPYLSFVLEKNSVPQMYNISTLGADGIMLTGYSTYSDGVLFDDGQLEITSIDTVTNIISGRIWGTTNEETSTVSGNFQVVIKH